MSNDANVRRFQLELADVIRNRVPAQAAVIVRKVAQQALQGVVRSSPVDTGRFRGNWQMQAGTPATGVLDRLDPSGSAALAAGESVIAQATIDAPLWLTNNVPYAGRLEDGHSDQAPEGVLGITVERLRSQFGRTRL